MAAELAASERLNYLSKKQRAVSSRHSRLIINANNGNEFNPSGVTTIQIPGGQPATYMDFQNSYLRFTVFNDSLNTGGADLEIQSGYDLIDRLEILADGQTISNIQEYGALVAQYMNTEVGNDWKEHFGKALTKTQIPGGSAVFSTSGDLTRTKTLLKVDKQNSSNVSGEMTICLPLVLTPLYSVNKYIPLVGRSNLQIRITWASAKKAFKSASAVADNLVRYTPVDFITSTVRLSADANAMVMQNTGGRFELICSDFRCASGTYNPKDQKSLALNCGFSFSSLDRVSFAFYQYLDDSSKSGVSTMSCGDILRYALAVNGEEYPRKRIEVSSKNISEAVAEVGIAHRSLADFNHQSSITEGSFYQVSPTTPEAGTFTGMIDTEAMQPHSGDSLYSGISTLGSVVQLVGDSLPGSTVNTDFRLLVFAQYTMALTLDLNGTGTYVVSI